MPIGTILLAVGLLIIAAVLITIPLFDRKRPALQPPSPREVLEAERRAVIQSVREMDFDHRTHKMGEDEYKAMRAEAMQRGAAILQQLETLPQHNIDDEIESRIAKLREREREHERAHEKEAANAE